MMLRRMLRDQRGAGAVELAVALPVLISMIYGIFTLGQLYYANAGIQHALGQAARQGNLCLGNTNGACTLPTSTALKALVSSNVFGTSNGTFDAPTLNNTTASSGYVTMTVTYHQTMDFLFFTGPTLNVVRSKRVYLADTPPTKADCDTLASQNKAPVNCSIYS